MEKHITQHKHELELSKNKHNDLHELLSDETKKNSELKQTIKNLKQEFTQNNEFDQLIEDYEGKLKQHEVELHKKHQLLSSYNLEIKELKQQLQVKTDSIFVSAEKDALIESLKAQVLKNEASSDTPLKEENQKLKNDMEQKVSEFDELKAALEQKKVALEQRTSEFDELKAALEQKTSELEQRTSEFDELKKQKNDHENEKIKKITTCYKKIKKSNSTTKTIIKFKKSKNFSIK